MTAEVLEVVYVQTPQEPGDHDKFSHYCDKDQLMMAMVEGIAIQALCGKVWIPTRDGQNYPVCPECKEVYESFKE